jgi:enamine deaminase RidA (YjgF/YER057c/UK114 family)
MKQFRNPQDIHQPVGSYSHQIEVSNERILIISGQVGMGPDGTIPTDPYEQLDLAFENIFRNLRAATMDVNDLVKITYYLVGEWDMTRRREIVVSKLQGHQPCSTLLYVAALATPQFRVELDAWASRAE